jgi:hypothetical protein
MSMLDRAPADFGAGRLAEAQRNLELIEEYWYAVIDLHFGGRRYGPRGHFRPAPSDDFLAVHGDEFMEHWRLPIAPDDTVRAEL